MAITVLIALAVYVFRFIWVYVLYPYFYLSVSPFQKMMSKEEDKTDENRQREVCMP